MTTVKKLAIVVGITAALWFVPAIAYGLIVGLLGINSPKADDHVINIVLGVGVLFLLGGIIYVAVDAAIRHNQRDTMPPR